jgi:foldase protein PrsA
MFGRFDTSDLRCEECAVKFPVAAVICGILAGGCAGGSKDPAPAPLAPSAAPQPQKAADATPPPSGASYDNQVVARINGKDISMGSLVQPLIETYGLNMLLNIVQLELAKQDAANAHVTVTPEDIAKERELTLSKLFGPGTKKEDYDKLLDQFLSQKGMKKRELELVIEQQAYLHKIATPMIEKQITEDKVQEAFRSLYGETVHVKHIECGNLQDIAEAKRRLAAGEPFEKVAREMSQNPNTAPLGGDLPPFSRQAGNYPPAFKEAAFNLKVGEVSDPVANAHSFHLIKLYERIAPKAVKYEDVKESVRADLVDRLSQVTVQKLRQQLNIQVLQTIQILDPTLKKEFADRLTQQQSKIKDPNEIRKEMEKERERLSPTSEPSPTPSPIVPQLNVPTSAPAAAAPAPAAAAPAATNPASPK